MGSERRRILLGSIPFTGELQAAIRARSLVKSLRDRVPIGNTAILVSLATRLRDFVSENLVEFVVTGGLEDLHDLERQVVGNVRTSRGRSTEESLVSSFDKANHRVHVLAFNFAYLNGENLALEELDRGFRGSLNTLKNEVEHEGTTLLNRMELFVLLQALRPQSFFSVVAEELEGKLHVFLHVGLLTN